MGRSYEAISVVLFLAVAGGCSDAPLPPEDFGWHLAVEIPASAGNINAACAYADGVVFVGRTNEHATTPDAAVAFRYYDGAVETLFVSGYSDSYFSDVAVTGDAIWLVGSRYIPGLYFTPYIVLFSGCKATEMNLPAAYG